MTGLDAPAPAADLEAADDVPQGARHPNRSPNGEPDSKKVAMNGVNAADATAVVVEAACNTWNGKRSQEELMAADECILLDLDDRVVGSANKFATHRRRQGSQGADAFLLHRAFSVFLFDSQNRLLLQQRAQTKITFPLLWTNTCCSHPLHGQEPPEVDGPKDVEEGTVSGAKHAAVRKLRQELGIQAEQLPAESFRFLTRIHYCAPDPNEPDPGEWGEHEVDYILLAKADVDLEPNPEEVEAVKYVTMEELRQLMKPDSGLTWSPWFRILADKFLLAESGWWSDLQTALALDNRFVDGQIHRFIVD